MLWRPDWSPFSSSRRSPAGTTRSSSPESSSLSFRWMTHHSSRGMRRAARVFRWRNRSAVAFGDGMVCSLFNCIDLRGTVTRCVRIGVGPKANRAPGTHHWDRHGYCATIHFATGAGSRNRVFQNSAAGLQLRQEPHHAHRLWTWSIPGGSRDSVAHPSLKTRVKWLYSAKPVTRYRPRRPSRSALSGS